MSCPRRWPSGRGRLRKIREAKAALEAEAQAEAEQSESEGRHHPGVPDDGAQRNFTDADSRIMPGPGGRDFVQAYNCQAVVDSQCQVIVAARATNRPSDKGQSVAMVEEAIDNTGAVPKEVSADAGYYSAKAVDDLCELGVDPFIAPEKTRHGTRLPPAPRGTDTQGIVGQGPDAAEAADQAGTGTLRPADADGGASVRPDQAGPWLPAVPAAQPGEGEPGMAAYLHRPQPAEAVPVRAKLARQRPGQRPRWGCQRTAPRRHHPDNRETVPARAFSIGRNGGRSLTQPQPQGQSNNPRTGS